jgi:dTDP-4-dehydrorhamnose 3,5-epimerase
MARISDRSRMEFISAEIPNVILIKPKVVSDSPGFFIETFRIDEFSATGLPTAFAQDNHSGSHRGTLRSLHYQIRQAQASSCES